MQFLAEAEAHVALPMPGFVYGVIAMALFVVLGFVTWSYRDVANRHEHKSSDSKGHH